MLFLSTVLLAICGSCIAEMQTYIPPDDGRVQRAAFVSSLIKPGDIGAEIGVAAGVFAYHVLLKNMPSKLYLIDPWEYGLQADVEMVRNPENQRSRDYQWQDVCNCFSPYKNVEIIRLKSEDAVCLFPDNYFNYVYIDGEHSYKAVMRDLTNYFPKVMVGGYIIGDDYGWMGVADAVKDFVRVRRDQLKFNPYHENGGGQFVIRRIQ